MQNLKHFRAKIKFKKGRKIAAALSRIGGKAMTKIIAVSSIARRKRFKKEEDPSSCHVQRQG